MSERGVFAVDRGIFDHPLFCTKEPFSRREAWLWLLAEAEWKPAKRQVSGRLVSLNRGQLAHSIRFMADAWGWSKSAVDRFLGRLKTETMIGTDIGTGVLVITVCKYNDYQKVSLPKRDTKEPDTGTGAGQERDRLENNESSEVTSSLRSDVEPKAKRATRIPDDFRPDLGWAIESGLTSSQAMTESDKFKDYWSSKGTNATKTDWGKTWHNWVRTAIERMPREGPVKRHHNNGMVNAIDDFLARFPEEANADIQPDNRSLNTSEAVHYLPAPQRQR